MIVEQRHAQIIRILQHKRFALVEELASELGVSSITIRRDLASLEQHAQVLRQRGGAALLEVMRGEEQYAKKLACNRAAKRAIARKSLSLIKDGDTIFLDYGTTNLELAFLLQEREGITVLTGDLPIATALVNSPAKLVVVGGTLQNANGCVYGTSAVEFLRRFRVRISFLAAPAIDRGWDVTTPVMEKAYFKQAAISISQNAYLAADSSRFYGVAISRICNLADLSGLITEKRFTAQEAQELEKKGVALIQA